MSWLRVAVGCALVLSFGLAPSAQAQQQDGCPAGEFTMDGCVMCADMNPPTLTGNKNPQGKLCFTCLRKKGALAPAPDAVPAGCTIMPRQPTSVALDQTPATPAAPAPVESDPALPWL